MIQNFFQLTDVCTATTSSTSDVPAKSYPNRGTWARVSDMLQYFQWHYFQWKAFDLLDKMRNNLWVVLLLEACDVTKHDRRLSPHLGFYQELEIG